MALSVFPASSGGGIKLVQRGSAGGAGDVTITAVDTTKAFVNVFGTASSGTVAATATISSTSMNMGNAKRNAFNNVGNGTTPPTMDVGNRTLSAGTNNLVSAVVQGFLANSTTLTVSGACRWEVVEFA